MSRAGIAVLAAGICLATAPGFARGQSLADRVADAGSEYVHFTYAVRPGVEICDNGIRVDGDDHVTWSRGRWGDDWRRNCRPGPAEVEVRVRESVREVELVTRPGERHDGVELGEVSPREAVDFLIDLARGEGAGRAAGEAVFPVTIADVPDVWRDLLTVAKDRSAPERGRKQALFWVGQAAADAVTEGLAEVALDQTEDQEIREAAVFAISQRPAVESVPILMDLAESADQAETRRTAMFWLAQSGDERAVEFFERVLLGRGGR